MRFEHAPPPPACWGLFRYASYRLSRVAQIFGLREAYCAALYGRQAKVGTCAYWHENRHTCLSRPAPLQCRALQPAFDAPSTAACTRSRLEAHSPPRLGKAGKISLVGSLSQDRTARSEQGRLVTALMSIALSRCLTSYFFSSARNACRLASRPSSSILPPNG